MCIYIRVLKRYTHQTTVRWRIFALYFLEEFYDAPVRYLPCSLHSYDTQNKFTKSKPDEDYLRTYLNQDFYFH